jgi:hypothetical protein
MKHYDGYAREWNELQSLAYAYLAEAHSIPKAQDLQRWLHPLRLWHYPAFAKQRTWSIYQQATWDRGFDAERFSKPLEGLEHGLHPQPTIEVRDRPVDTEELERRLLPLAEISFNLFAATGIGIDGESLGVEYPCGRAKAEWWCKGPDTWSELTAWAAEMREWLSMIAAGEPDQAL